MDEDRDQKHYPVLPTISGVTLQVHMWLNAWVGPYISLALIFGYSIYLKNAFIYNKIQSIYDIIIDPLQVYNMHTSLYIEPACQTHLCLQELAVQQRRDRVLRDLRGQVSDEEGRDDQRAGGNAAGCNLDLIFECWDYTHDFNFNNPMSKYNSNNVQKLCMFTGHVTFSPSCFQFFKSMLA